MNNETKTNKHQNNSDTSFRWVRVGSLQYPRSNPIADILEDGRVLVQGGCYINYLAGNREVFPPPEVWDPNTNKWSIADDLAKAVGVKSSRPDYNQEPFYGRKYGTLTPLPDGKLLLTGGYEEGGCCGPFEIRGESATTAVIIDPSTGQQFPAGSPCISRHLHAAVRFPNGTIMLIGGEHDDSGAIDNVELGLTPEWESAGFTSALVANFKVQLSTPDSHRRFD